MKRLLILLLALLMTLALVGCSNEEEFTEKHCFLSIFVLQFMEYSLTTKGDKNRAYSIHTFRRRDSKQRYQG